MTNGEKIKEIFPNSKIITQYDNPFGDRFMVFTLNNEDMQVNMDWWNAEYKEPTIKSEALVSLDVYKQVAWERDIAIQQLHELGYEFGQKKEPTKNDLGVDFISRQEVLRLLANSIGKTNTYLQTKVLKMSSVTPQVPRCKECKWWKDSDGEYRRGCGAESQCPINRREVFEGNGYCFLFEPQKSEVEV